MVNNTANNTPPQLAEISSKSLRQRVLDTLRDAILNGDFKPGQTLVETELAAQLGVSRAPLREALQVLAAEGLVETIPYHCSTVRPLTKTDIEELYSTRGMLESFAIERIIARNDSKDIAQLQAIYNSMKQAADSGDLKRLSGEDHQFHDTLIQLSGHSLLQSIWGMVAGRIQQVMALRNKQNSDLGQIVDKHLPIIEAIMAGDTALATQLIKTHAASATEIVLDAWETGAVEAE